jgi:hypothetical protein
MSPIPTEWRGWRFRSRCEARWAVFFEHIGIDFVFEPEGFVLADGTCYLPDFWLPVVRLFCEVKPGFPTEGESVKAMLLSRDSGANVMFLEGPPDFREYNAVVMDCGLYNLVPFSLDIGTWPDYYREERRLFCGSCQNKESDFSGEYREAVYAARAERFGVR